VISSLVARLNFVVNWKISASKSATFHILNVRLNGKTQHKTVTMQIKIDANRFSNLDEFYDEIESKLTRNLEFRIGRNLDAFNDVLAGGFGVFDYDESVDLIWIESNKSRNDLNEKYNNTDKTIFEMLIEVIKDNDHINLNLK